MIEPYEIHCRVCGCLTGIQAVDAVVSLTDQEHMDLNAHERACTQNSALGRQAFARTMSRIAEPHHRRRYLRGGHVPEANLDRDDRDIA